MKLLRLFMISFLFIQCINDSSEDIKKATAFNLLMLNLADANFNSKLSGSVPSKRKPKPIPDVQFLGKWSVSTSEKEFLLNFKDDRIEKKITHQNQDSDPNYQPCGDDPNPFLNLCYVKYEWKIENNQKKVRRLYGYEDLPLKEEWCDINFNLSILGNLKVEKNDCGIADYTYKKSE